MGHRRYGDLRVVQTAAASAACAGGGAVFFAAVLAGALFFAAFDGGPSPTFLTGCFSDGLGLPPNKSAISTPLSQCPPTSSGPYLLSCRNSVRIALEPVLS